MQLLIIWIVNEKLKFFRKTPQKNSIVHQLPAPRTPFFCEGRLFRSPELEKDNTTLWLDLTRCGKAPQFAWQEVQGRVRIRVMGETKDLQQGDFIRLKTSLRLPHDFQNPGSFKSTLYLQTEGIDALGFVSDPRWIARLPSPDPKGFARWLEKVRSHLREKVFQRTSQENGAFILSLLIGDRHLLGPVWEDVFRKAGVSHILSISGLHVTMVSLIFLTVFRFFPLAVLIPVWLYVAIASFPVPAVRAGAMASLFLVGLSIWRRLDFLSALALAAFLILCLSPLSLFNVSFQLSFVAVLFLILFFPKVPGSLWGGGPKGAWHLLWHLLIDSFAISVITLAALWPLLLFHFHEVSIVGLVANAVVVPLVNFLVMPISFLAIVVSPLWHVAGFFSEITLKIVNWFSSHSGWGVFNGALSFWQLVFYYGAIFLFLIRKELFATKWKLAVSGCLMALVLWGGKMPADGKLKVTFVDVGQGDCSIIQLPNGKVWVVDGGGIKGSDWDVGRFVVAPYLWENGIRNVEYLFLSHPHHDHYKGLGFLAEKFGPKVLFTNGDNAPEAEDLEWKEFLGRVEKGKVAIQKVTRDTKAIEETGVRLEFLAPGSEGTIPHFDVNDNSVVMRLRYKEVSFLLTGDLMEVGEMLLMESKLNLKSQVLKTGHHGSETSTNDPFLEAVNPKYAVISVGAYNSYGMPDQSLIDHLQQKGISVYRTDTQGAITFTTDGQKVDVQTFVR